MKGILLITAGVAAGFLIAHAVSRTPEGKRFFDDVDSRARAFGFAVADGYKTREVELLAAVSVADDVVSDLTRHR